MADPHIRPVMDGLDTLSVILYRTGLTLSGPALLVLLFHPQHPHLPVWLAAVLCAANLHIYDKRIRTVLQWATWGGLLVALAGWSGFALGGALVTLSGLGFKEYHCFRVPGLQLQPLWVALFWGGLTFDVAALSMGAGILAAALFLVLAVAKWRMPLDYDIGDKSKYEI